MARRRIAAAAATAIVLAACSSDGSILDAGIDEPPIVTAGPDGSFPSTIPATTTTTPLADLPECPVEALADADGPVEITFWHGFGGETENALQDLTADYNAAQADVRVRLQNQGGYNETIDKYFQSSTDDLPELVVMPEYMVKQMLDSDTIVPADACIEASGFDMSAFLPRAVSAYTTQGVLWGTPFNVSNPVLYYNKRVFEEAGLDPDEPPTTLGELRRYSQRIVNSGAASFGIALDTGQDNGGGWFLEQWFAKGKQLYANNQNGRSAPATQVLFNQPFGVELLTAVQSMVEDGLAAHVGANPSGYDTFLKLTGDSPAAMTIGTSAALGTVIATLDGGLVPGLTSDDFGIGPMPGPDVQPGVLVGGGALYVVADKGDEQSAAAWDYITWMVSAETQSTWASRTGYVPVRQDSIDVPPLSTTYRDDPRFKVAYDQLDASSDDPSSSGPVLGPLREIRAVNSEAIGAILEGSDVQTELDRAADQANRLLRNYNARNPT